MREIPLPPQGVRGYRITILVCALLWVACGRDESPAPITRPPSHFPEWRLQPQPAVRIAPGDTSQQAQLLNVFAATIDSRGRVIVGNSGRQQVLCFTSDGELRFASGRSGDGPGEFRSISWVGEYQDSVFVYDLLANRFTVLDSTGRVARGFTAPFSAFPLAITPHGRLVAVLDAPADPQHIRGAFRDSVTIIVLSREGQIVDSLVRLPGAEWFVYEGQRGLRASRIPYGVASHVVAVDSVMIHGENNSDEFAVYTLSGDFLRRFSVPLPAAALRQADINDALAEIRDEQTRSVLTEHLRNAGGSGRRAPKFVGVLADPHARLWIQQYASPTTDSVSWLVVDTRGTPLGSVMLPATTALLAVRGQSILLREERDDGVVLTLHEFDRQ